MDGIVNPVFKFQYKSLTSGDGFKDKNSGEERSNTPRDKYTDGKTVSGETNQGDKVKGQIVEIDKDKDGEVIRVRVITKKEEKFWIEADKIDESLKDNDFQKLLDLVKHNKLSDKISAYLYSKSGRKAYMTMMMSMGLDGPEYPSQKNEGKVLRFEEFIVEKEKFKTFKDVKDDLKKLLDLVKQHKLSDTTIEFVKDMFRNDFDWEESF